MLCKKVSSACTPTLVSTQVCNDSSLFDRAPLFKKFFISNRCLKELERSRVTFKTSLESCSQSRKIRRLSEIEMDLSCDWRWQSDRNRVKGVCIPENVFCFLSHQHQSKNDFRQKGVLVLQSQTWLVHYNLSCMTHERVHLQVISCLSCSLFSCLAFIWGNEEEVRHGIKWYFRDRMSWGCRSFVIAFKKSSLTTQTHHHMQFGV